MIEKYKASRIHNRKNIYNNRSSFTKLSASFLFFTALLHQVSLDALYLMHYFVNLCVLEFASRALLQSKWGC